MAKDHEPTTVEPPSNAERQPMALDEAAIEAARHSLDDGAVTPSHGGWGSSKPGQPRTTSTPEGQRT